LRILPWVVLIGVSSAGAYAMEIAADSPVVAGVAMDSLVVRPAPPEVTHDETARMFVIIWFSDPATGTVNSIRCMTAEGRVGSGVLETDPENEGWVISQVCDEGTLDVSTVSMGRESQHGY
jgi:hypothetical protein